jgi:Ca-activated chloride channel family protein
VSFSSPLWLFALLLVPLALGAQRLARRRARRFALRFPAVPTVLAAIGTRPDWRRHVPVVAMLAAVSALAFALARPHVTTRVPVREASVMLVLDRSGSMDANDVQPTRLTAAEKAANTFVNQLPSTARVGVVTFSSAPDTIVPPTTDHVAARRAIDTQTASGATATGDALSVALNLLHQGNTNHGRSAIVLLSDGAANAGQDPISVSQRAEKANISIYTVALGTSSGSLPNPDPFGPPVAVPPDPELMQQIARTSHGRSFSAQDADGLISIYKGLGTQLGSKAHETDITVAFAAAALALLLVAGVGSLRWSGRLP